MSKRLNLVRRSQKNENSIERLQKTHEFFSKIADNMQILSKDYKKCANFITMSWKTDEFYQKIAKKHANLPQKVAENTLLLSKTNKT